MKIKEIFTLNIISVLLISININLPSSRNQTQIVTDSITTIKFSFVGDLMCHSPQIEYAKAGKDSFDFNPSYSIIKKYLSDADISFGNLETVVHEKKKVYSGYPLFNSPKSYLEALKYSGLDILFTSNNHSIDQGKNGLLETLNHIRSIGIEPIGTFNSIRDRDSIRIYFVKGFRLGILSYTYGLNGNYLAEKDKYHINLIDTNSIKRDIEKLNSKQTDLNIVYFHFGDEYSRKPSNFQKKIVDATIRYGADFIIASHPHVIQPIEKFSTVNRKMKNGIVAYSLGNFISNQRWRLSDAGIILNIDVSKKNSNDSIYISSVSIIPTWVFKGNVAEGKKFIVLPADTNMIKTSIDFLTKEHKLKMTEAYNDTYKMFKVENPSKNNLR